MGEISLQTKFLNRIKEMIPPTHSFVDEVAELLGISIDSVYRRVRGETSLTIEEIVLLSRNYRVPLEMLNEADQGSVMFKYSKIENIEQYKLYFQFLLKSLQDISRMKNTQLIYAAVDIPISHHLGYEALAAFKSFYWLREIVNESSIKEIKFDFSFHTDEMKEICKQIYSIYQQIPCIEIWTSITTNSTFKQIEFYLESGLFKKFDDAKSVIDDFENMIQTIEKQAEESNKLLTKTKISQFENNYILYQSEIEIGNNCVLVGKDDTKVAFMGFNTFNIMSTSNQNYCLETERWLQNLMRKSQLISGVSQKQRYRFFKEIYEQIDKLRQMLTSQKF